MRNARVGLAWFRHGRVLAGGIEGWLARALIAGEAPDGTDVRVDAAGEELIIELDKPSE